VQEQYEMDSVHDIIFEGTRIEIFPTSTRITLADGAVIVGAPEDTDTYRETARETGYDTDVTTLCIEHELTHVALAFWLQTISPTLEFVGKQVEVDLDLRELEESAVLAFQKYARAMKIDLVKLFSTS
jgi:hypothetical protein